MLWFYSLVRMLRSHLKQTSIYNPQHLYTNIVKFWHAIRLNTNSHFLSTIATAWKIPLLIQKVGHHSCECLGMNVAVFLQLVQVKPELQSLMHCLGVCCQSGQTYEEMWTHLEYLLEIQRQSLRLDSKPPISSYRNAVLPFHGHNGPTIICHNRLQKKTVFSEINLNKTLLQWN